MPITPRSLVRTLAMVAALAAAPLAAQAPAPDSTLLDRANESRMKGVESAPITIVELGDFECPFCRQFSVETLRAVDSAYVATGRARLVFLNVPLPGHATAFAAAEAALCAGAQGKFWAMHDRLYAEQAAWSASRDAAADFQRYAAALGLDAAAFGDCARNDRVAPLVIDDLLEAARGGVSATPTFVILRAPRPGEEPGSAQRILQGAVPFSEFQKAITELGS